MTNQPFPTLIVDVEHVRANIREMNEKCRINNLEFRPHFKTHQSKDIGRIFREYDVTGITVSSLKMATYFAEDGWKDINIAFPINVLAAEAYNQLAKQCELKSLAISREAVQLLDSQLTNSMGLYVEVDPDYGRSGIPIKEIGKIADVIKAIEGSKQFTLSGFYCHTGRTYQARSQSEIRSISTRAIDEIKLLQKSFPGIPICFGDTPSCSILDDFGPVSQLSPGNFVFYDWMQVQIGSCSADQIAVYMVCPVIEKFDDRQEILIHGGAVHFSKDSIVLNDATSFGQLVHNQTISSNNYLKSISQEHGLMSCETRTYSDINLGDKLKVYPIHSCLTADVMREYHTTDGRVLDHMNGSFRGSV